MFHLIRLCHLLPKAEKALFARCRGRSWRRGRCAAVAAAGVHDVAGAFPGFNEAFAGIRAVELQGEVVHVGCQLHEGGGEGGNAGGGHAAPGGGGVADGGAGEIENGRGLVQ